MTAEAKPGERRIALIDVARGVALLAMAIYHGAWDLEFFGYIDAGTVAHGGWKLFARCIASSFLVLVGVSLVLAHERGIRWRPFLIRLAMVVAAAAAISLATYVMDPNTFIFFGILHQIALASLLGLAFLRVPAPLTLLVAAGVIALPLVYSAPVFEHPALLWLGLAQTPPRSNDYVPFFPWFAPVLIGIAAARLMTAWGARARLAAVRPGGWSRPLTFIGRHSLAFYLLHQPILLACVWSAAQLFPPQIDDTAFLRQCQAQCEALQEAAFCTRYCGCMLTSMGTDGTLQRLQRNETSEELRISIEQHVLACSASGDGPPQTDSGGGQP